MHCIEDLDIALQISNIPPDFPKTKEYDRHTDPLQ